LAKFNKSQNLLHEEMHENLIAFLTPHTFSNNIASPKYCKSNQSHGTPLSIAMKNVPPTPAPSAIENIETNLLRIICNKQNQTKKKEVKGIAPIIIGSCCTQLHNPSNMNDEIQKVGKFK
jgi:hypothetical protein